MNIEDLWWQRLESTIHQIATGGTDYKEVATLTAHISADYHGRFLIELLQNAEDQTTKADIDNGLVIIVRTETHIYMLNQGLPFDDSGIRSITSAGISTKNPEESIGNKGIGFKAVFQISSAPEIFSVEQGMPLTAARKVAFRINGDLFDDDAIREKMKMDIHKLLKQDTNLHDSLKVQLGGIDNMWFRLFDLLKYVAPFKFPLVLENNEFDAHCASMLIPKRLLNRMSTLIALPLNEDNETCTVVESALDEMVNSDNFSGSTLLFLNGISSLRIYDRVRGKAWLVSRRQINTSCRLAKGSTIMSIRTSSACAIGPRQIRRKSTNWWRIQRQFGRGGDDFDAQDDEATKIKKAVERLPKGLSEVENGHASVALPRSPKNQSLPERFPIEGRMCIALPTLMKTGTPAWLDGSFFGNAARKEIDLDPASQPYNRLVFEQCVDLFWQVIEHVKAEGEIIDKREILFWFESKTGADTGALTKYFKKENTLSAKKIILSRSGDKFLEVRELQLPEEQDGSYFETLFGEVPNLETFGFKLPDSWLMQKGRDIIDSLKNKSCTTVPRSTYFTRSENKKSLIEAGCDYSRERGREWWEPFFDWLIDERFKVDDLSDQAVLPVVGGKLACPKVRVFLRPHGLPVDESVNSEHDEYEESIDGLDKSLAAAFRFLDEQCIQVRDVDHPRDLTPLARKISPDNSKGLVRRPRRPELIQDVLIPTLSKLTDENPRDPLCIQLLARIGEWLSEMGTKERNSVNLDQLLVPTTDDQVTWCWRQAKEIYLGPCWVSDQDHASLLERAFGHRIGARLPDWENFCKWLQNNPHQDNVKPELKTWRKYMESMGVSAHPRVLTHRPRSHYFKSNSYEYLTLESQPPCPFNVLATDIWGKYLKYLCKRRANTCSGQLFYVDQLSWIDGLECPNTREAVMEMILRWPKKYEQNSTTKVARDYKSDSHDFKSLWMWVIHEEHWTIVPSNDGPKPIDTVWILQHEEKNRKFVEEKLLVWIPDKIKASSLTNALGVYSSDKAPINRIICEIHHVAERFLPDKSADSSAKMLVQTLYEWLDRCAVDQGGTSTPNPLAPLLNKPIPMFKGDQVYSVKLKDEVRVYLNDDLQRSPHIKDFSKNYSIPTSAKCSFKNLFRFLENLLGTECVRRTSHEHIDLNFSENNILSRGRLLELIERFLNAHPGEIRIQLAALIAYGRPDHPIDPTKKEFEDCWNQMRDCRVVFGRFSPGKMTCPALFDAMASNGPTLYVADNEVPSEEVSAEFGVNLVSQSWRVVGPEHRDVFEAFAGALAKGKPRDFLEERRVGETEWDEVKSAIGTEEVGRARLHVIAFAIWRRKYPQEASSKFDSEWDNHGELLNNVINFFNIDETIARSRVNDALRVVNDEGEADLAEGFGITASEWQDSREQLGIDRVQFKQTILNYRKAVQWATGVVSILASRYVRINEETAKIAITKIKSLDCSVALAETRAKYGDVLVEVINQAVILLENMNNTEMQRLAKRLRRQTDNDSKFSQNLEIRGVTRRELNHMIDSKENERANLAHQSVQSVVEVGKLLTQIYDEKIDIDINDTKMLRHTKTGWANAYASLRVLKKVVTIQAPKTAKCLGQQRAFSEIQDYQTLLNKIPELNNQRAVRDPKNQPKTHILGLEKTPNEIDVDLASGVDGKIVPNLCEHVNRSLDLNALACRQHKKICKDELQPHGVTGGGGNIYSHDKELIGYLGELFVHEHFMTGRYPDYDISCWVSENRKGYKALNPESIVNGCDFRYRDSTGMLTGRDDAPLCYIEVKTTTGDRGTSFSMSSNEWRLAQKCHDEGRNSVYVIILVRKIFETPEIYDVVPDPVRAHRDGWLQIRNKDLYIVVGRAIE